MKSHGLLPGYVLIAATSIEHDLTVATHNTDDFKRCGARCLNPWGTVNLFSK